MNVRINEQIAALRTDYTLKTFNEEEVTSDPMHQFDIWFKEALEAQVEEPNAMTLATVKADHKPSARIVLLKGYSQDGFTFFTNYLSHKGEQLSQNPHAALVFFWRELQRQVRIEGTITKLSDAENDTYFKSRPLGSQIGAIVSPQSMVIPNRSILEQNAELIHKQLNNNSPDRPAHWGGYLVRPTLIEFWQGRSNRLHDRFEFILNEQQWMRQRLAP